MVVAETVQVPAAAAWIAVVVVAVAVVLVVAQQPESVGRRVVRDLGRGRGSGRLELPGVGIEARMLKFAMGPQVVAACVRGSAQRTLEPAWEVHVVVVAYVCHYFPAQLAPVQVAPTRQFVKRKPHVPGFWTCKNENNCFNSTRSPSSFKLCTSIVGSVNINSDSSIVTVHPRAS